MHRPAPSSRSGCRAGALTVLSVALLLLPTVARAENASPPRLATLWFARNNGPGRNVDEPYAVGVSPDGSTVYVTGSSLGGSGTYDDYATMAYDAATGSERWVSRFNGSASREDGAAALAVSLDGSTVYVTGSSRDRDSRGGDNYATVAYDAATGTQLWLTGYNGPAGGDDA